MGSPGMRRSRFGTTVLIFRNIVAKKDPNRNAAATRITLQVVI
jgi:hypothetical protein